MKNRDFRTITLLCLGLTLGCSEPRPHEQSEISESDYKMKSVMINNTRCTLPGKFVDLSQDEIVGIWKDTLFWKMQPNDSCYYGIDELNVTQELELKQTKTYQLRTIYSRPEYNEVEMGEYFLNHTPEGVTNLLLAKNPKGEVVFEQGDTMKSSVIYDLLWVDSVTMILDTKNGYGNYQAKLAVEYKKTTHQQ